MTKSRTAGKSTARTAGKWQGMNWITQHKRLAIYLRDSLACAWCGVGVEEGVMLSLDHIKPHSKGGSNHESNLVTCCKNCNDSRGNRSVNIFASVVAEYRNHGMQAATIIARVQTLSRRTLTPHIAAAKAMIADRGSVAKVLASKI